MKAISTFTFLVITLFHLLKSQTLNDDLEIIKGILELNEITIENIFRIIDTSDQRVTSLNLSAPDGIGPYTKTIDGALTSPAIPKHITILSDDIEGLSELKILKLNCNELNELPAKFINLSKLEWLDISYNQFQSIPDQLMLLPKLTHLYFCGYALDTLKSIEGGFPSLKMIDLSRAGISQIDSSFCSIDSLESLSLDGNKLSELPPELVNLSSIKMLSIHCNDFN